MERPHVWALAVIQKLDAFFPDRERGGRIPAPSLKSEYKELDLVEFLFSVLVDIDPRFSRWSGSKRALVEMEFDSGNFCKIEVAFTGNWNCEGGKMLQLYLEQTGSPEHFRKTVQRSLVDIFEWYPNPFHRLRAIMHEIAQGRGFFNESWLPSSLTQQLSS